MVFGFLYLNAQKYGLIDDSTGKNLLSTTKRMVLVVSAAVLGLGGYTAFTVTCRNKPECNEIHSYIVFIPVIIPFISIFFIQYISYNFCF